MLKQVAAAIAQEDYQTAARLLKPLIKTDKHNPWVQFYVGRVQEGLGKRTEAQKLYLKLLPQATNPKLMSQIRQGIGRIEQYYTTKQQNAIAQAVESPGGDGQGMLVLESIATKQKQAAAQAFGQIFKLDAYTARLQLPSRGWRLYRTGKIGELQYYVRALQNAQIPSFAIALDQLPPLKVFTIHYFSSLAPQPKVRCINTDGKAGVLTFAWSDVARRVMGRVPLFESVVTMDARRRLKRKTQTQDYVPFYDLHLPSKRCILRLCERNYEFNRGMSLTPPTRSPIERDTVSQSWRYLTEHLSPFLSTIPTWSEFDTFAPSALDCREFLGQVEAGINLERRIPSLWDAAFHLYSAAAYLRSR